MLQSEKSSVPEFDDWYASHQAALRADPVMKWLHDARNQVVKQSDLATTSVARAVVHNNITHAVLTAELPPIVPTRFAALALLDKLPEPFSSHRDDLVMSVERRWSVGELPDRELLDALAHTYGVLSRIVTEAHERAGANYEQRGPDDQPVTTPGGRLPCMITTLEVRTARIALRDGRPLDVSLLAAPAKPDAVAIATKRYRLKEELPPAATLPNDALERAAALVRIAKKVHAKDRYHQRMVFFRTSSGWLPTIVDARDRPEKYAIMRSLAETVRREQADAIIEIGEVWISSLEEMASGRMPEAARDRQEALLVSVATAQGAIRRYLTPFRRTMLGKIKFGETHVQENEVVPYYLSPILEVWGLPLPENEGDVG